MLAPESGSFLPLIRRLIGDEALLEVRHGWVAVRPRVLSTWPVQGWKLHVAAHSSNASQVLAATLPVLTAAEVRFKVVASRQQLAALNGGAGGLTQVGKFITAYSRDDAEATRLADELDAATAGLTGPVVPSDRRLRAGSLVHYRYGSFGGSLVQLPDGSVAGALHRPDGGLDADERRPFFSPPDWVSDPFAARENPPVRGPFGLTPSASRYQVLAVLSDSGRGQVLLGLDTVARRRCVIKTAPLAVGGEGGAEAALRHEAAVLARLSPHPGCPEVYDVLQLEDQVLLVMQDIDGDELTSIVARRAAIGKPFAEVECAALGRRLVELVAHVHAQGLVHRDLKSANVLLTADGSPWLLDYELAAAPGEGRPGAGTRGYMSPQQAAGAGAASADDVYSLGALLFLLSSGAEPSAAPDPSSLLARPLSLLTPGISSGLADLIEACLSTDPARRPDLTGLAHALAVIEGRSAVGPRTPASGATVPSPTSTSRERMRDAARQIGDALCEAAVPAPGDTLTWHSAAPHTLPVPYRQINNGVPGVLLALAALCRELGVDHHRQVLQRGARWLARSTPLPGAQIAGLYAGEAGVGTALLLAGATLDDDQLISAAHACEQRLRAYPFTTPDLFHGTAGRLRFLVLLWQHSRDDGHLAAAWICARRLLEEAAHPRPEEACWSLPGGDGQQAAPPEASYAHGTAGIADALLDLYEACGDEVLLANARGAGRWIERQGVPSLPDQSGLDWGHAGFSGLWCYGASGIAPFLLRLARHTSSGDFLATAKRAGRTAARAGRHADSTLCHGLAGSIECLLDLHAATGEDEWLREARQLERLLSAFRTPCGSAMSYSSQPGADELNTAYMVGDAGVATCLLRLAREDRPARLLTLAGFAEAVPSAPVSPAADQPSRLPASSG